MGELDDGRPVGPGKSAPSASRRRARTKTVLVVDDDEDVRRFVVEVLRRDGFVVLEAHDGRSAIGRWVDLTGRLDLLITDLQMPASTGLEVAAMVSAARPETAVVVMTGDPTALRDEEIGIPGRVLVKPFTVAELRAAVARALASDR